MLVVSCYLSDRGPTVAVLPGWLLTGAELLHNRDDESTTSLEVRGSPAEQSVHHRRQCILLSRKILGARGIVFRRRHAQRRGPQHAAGLSRQGTPVVVFESGLDTNGSLSWSTVV
jgi:hypothetical protein